jgi:hypothetical protein
VAADAKVTTNDIFQHYPCHRAGYAAAAAFNAFNKHANSDGSPSIYATSRPPESGMANLAVASGYFFDTTQHSDTSSLAKRATSTQTTAVSVKTSPALGGDLTGDICKIRNWGGDDATE